MVKRRRAFSYQRAEDFDPLVPVWHALHKRSGKYVGAVQRVGPNCYKVRLPKDIAFYKEFGSRIEAARWLQEHLGDRAIFDEDDDEYDNDETSD
jgi:hypothetical protein